MNKNIFFAILSLLILSCSENGKKEIGNPMTEVITPLETPVNTIDKSKLDYNNKTSLWYLNEKRFSGYAVTYFEDSTLLQKFGILDGKKQNEAIDWYPDGEIKHSANYYQGKLHGEKKSWSPDSTHVLVSHLNYHLGKAHGVQKKWYSTGEIFKVLRLNKGKAEGIQQAFRKNGDLFANYEVKEGRIFGLKRAALCFGLEEQNIQYSK